MSIWQKLTALFSFKRQGRNEAMKPDKIIVGLGNPGSKYQGTRHNAGYMVLAELAKRNACGKPTKKFQGDVFEIKIAGQNILLLCPTTFMNLSGRAVSAAMRFYKVALTDLLVVCDDVDLPVGRIRFRDSGGSGGQKGIKDIIAQLGSERFSRLRIGIGRPPEGVDTADYVLSGFRSDEKEKVDYAIQKGADAALFWMEKGTAEAANHYNGTAHHSGHKNEDRDKNGK